MNRAIMTPDASEKRRLGRYGSVSGTTGAQPVTSALHWPSCPAVEGSTAERILGSPGSGSNSTPRNSSMPLPPKGVEPAYQVLSSDKSESAA